MSKPQTVQVTVESLPLENGKALVPYSDKKNEMNGGLDGASQLNANTLLWHAPDYSADEEVRQSSDIGTLRTRDQIRNNGYVGGSVETFKDSTIGAHLRLNADPDFKYLGLDEVWAEEWKDFWESYWELYAEGSSCWADASRKMTVTEMLRLGVGMYCANGDMSISSEWLRVRDYPNRPLQTAFKIFDSRRICNPNGISDNKALRSGIELGTYGENIAYNIRTAYKTSPYAQGDQFRWNRVAAEKPWGRKMILYYADIRRAEQTRANSRMLAALKEMRMLDIYQDTVLQNAITNATFAATIESELPRDIVYAQLGELGSSQPSGSPVAGGPLIEYMTMFLQAASEYQGGSKNLALNGSRIPHLLPGTKLNLQQAGNPGGVGTNFEDSWLRHFSRAIGISFEEFSGNFSNTNYSSAKASMVLTERTMRAVRRFLVGRAATDMYSNFMEEVLNREGKNVPLPRNAPSFYERMNRDAYTKAKWIPSARGQLDEMKETQAAILRMNAGLSSREDETSTLGRDYRQVTRQRAREKALDKLLGLDDPNLTIAKDTGNNSSKQDSTP